MVDYKKDMGRRLIQARLAHDIRTAREMAKIVGVVEQTYSRWERGERTPPIQTLEKICRTLQITSDWVFFGDGRGLPVSTVQRLESQKVD